MARSFLWKVVRFSWRTICWPTRSKCKFFSSSCHEKEKVINENSVCFFTVMRECKTTKRPQTTNFIPSCLLLSCLWDCHSSKTAICLWSFQPTPQSPVGSNKSRQSTGTVVASSWLQYFDAESLFRLRSIKFDSAFVLTVYSLLWTAVSRYPRSRAHPQPSDTPLQTKVVSSLHPAFGRHQAVRKPFGFKRKVIVLWLC